MSSYRKLVPDKNPFLIFKSRKWRQALSLPVLLFFLGVAGIFIPKPESPHITDAWPVCLLIGLLIYATYRDAIERFDDVESKAKIQKEIREFYPEDVKNILSSFVAENWHGTRDEFGKSAISHIYDNPASILMEHEGDMFFIYFWTQGLIELEKIRSQHNLVKHTGENVGHYRITRKAFLLSQNLNLNPSHDLPFMTTSNPPSENATTEKSQNSVRMIFIGAVFTIIVGFISAFYQNYLAENFFLKQTRLAEQKELLADQTDRAREARAYFLDLVIRMSKQVNRLEYLANTLTDKQSDEDKRGALINYVKNKMEAEDLYYADIERLKLYGFKTELYEKLHSSILNSESVFYSKLRSGKSMTDDEAAKIIDALKYDFGKVVGALSVRVQTGHIKKEFITLDEYDFENARLKK